MSRQPCLFLPNSNYIKDLKLLRAPVEGLPFCVALNVTLGCDLVVKVLSPGLNVTVFVSRGMRLSGSGGEAVP